MVIYAHMQRYRLAIIAHRLMPPVFLLAFLLFKGELALLGCFPLFAGEYLPYLFALLLLEL
mgnify:FL=1